jgi:nuclear cap-binding protein subunit 2
MRMAAPLALIATLLVSLGFRSNLSQFQMADVLLFDLTPRTDYVDRKALLAASSEEAYLAHRDAEYGKSTTVYIGNLSYYTTESQIIAHMSSVGPIKDVVMGLNANNAQPCGFCFVEYVTQDAAAAAVLYLNLSRLDDRVVRVSWDGGAVRESGRFWGRGFTGGQTRDEYHQGLDTARGGLSVRRAVEAGIERVVVADEMITYGWMVRPPPRGPRQVKKELGGAFDARDKKRARGET